MKKNVSISDILSPLSEQPSQAYISDALQVADVLEWMFSQAPFFTPTDAENRHIAAPVVRQSTFSISEEFLRRMWGIRQRYGARFILVIDRKALQKTMSLWVFVRHVYDQVFLTDNHSKVLILEAGDGFRCAMATSQNLTRGNRLESCVISSQPGIYDALLRDFNDIINFNSVPMHEIMPVYGLQESRQPSAAAAADVTSPVGPQPVDIQSEVERLASYFVPISDIATVLELDPSALRIRISDPEDPLSVAYRRGKAKAKIAVRAQEMQLARIGSPLGMQSVRENLLTMEAEEV